MSTIAAINLPRHPRSVEDESKVLAELHADMNELLRKPSLDIDTYCLMVPPIKRPTGFMEKHKIISVRKLRDDLGVIQHIFPTTGRDVAFPY